MTAKFPVIVRFKPALATTLLISGGAIFLSSTLSFLAGHFPFGLIASFAFIFAGVSLQRHPYFRLDRREFIAYKPTGKEDYRCALTSICDLEIDPDSDEVYLLSSGDRRKMPLYRWLADDQGWEEFRQLVAIKDTRDTSSDDDGSEDLAGDLAGDSAGDLAGDSAEDVIDASTPA